LIRISVTIFILIFAGIGPAGAENPLSGPSSHYLISTVRARAIAMGGAQTAVLDGLSSAFYNPAALGLRGTPAGSRFALHLNPVGGYSALSYRDRLSARDDYRGLDWINLTGLFIKSVTFSSNSITAAIVLSEELTANPQHPRNELLAPDGILDWNMTAVTGRARLAAQISIGAAGYILTTQSASNRREYCFSYGVLIQPARALSVGLSYFDCPQDVAGHLFADSRLVDETINIGLSFQPSSLLQFSLDLRNVAEDTAKLITRELHLGLEISPLSLITLRGGFYQREDDGRAVYSAGLGLFDGPHGKDHFIFRFLTLNYGFRAIDMPKDYYLQHFMSLLFTL